MNLTAWLIGDKAESILNELTAPDGYPPAEIWVPLDRTMEYATKALPKYRSAWAHRTTNDEEWVDFAAAADTIIEAVGPHALANPRSVTIGKALLSNVQTRDGILMAKVPPYFSTVATEWTFDQVGQHPLISRSGRETAWTPIGRLDMKATLGNPKRGPDLIIDDNGPRMLRRHTRTYFNVSGMKEASSVMTAIRKLPPDTAIRSAWCAN